MPATALRSPAPRWSIALLLSLILPLAAADSYPALRDSHDPELQAHLDAALFARKGFRKGTDSKEFSVVIADVTDLHHPQVAWYNPDLMAYAASLPKIDIAYAALVKIDRGDLVLDDELRGQLVRMIKKSSNRDATAVLNKVGMDDLQAILQDEQYGKLYDPEYGGGLWVGKPYSKQGAVKRDPIKNLSHGASALAAARFYYGVMTGQLIDHKYLPLLQEMFGNPGINHKFVKGLKDREGIEIYRKSGTWRDFHADSAVVVRDDLVYIVVGIDHYPTAGEDMVGAIRVVDDAMLEWAALKAAK